MYPWGRNNLRFCDKSSFHIIRILGLKSPLSLVGFLVLLIEKKQPGIYCVGLDVNPRGTYNCYQSAYKKLYDIGCEGARSTLLRY